MDQLSAYAMGSSYDQIHTLYSHISLQSKYFTYTAVVPKLFRMTAPLMYWVTGRNSPLELQSYTLYRMTGFPSGFGAPMDDFCSSLGSHLVLEPLTYSNVHELFLGTFWSFTSNSRMFCNFLAHMLKGFIDHSLKR